MLRKGRVLDQLEPNAPHLVLPDGACRASLRPAPSAPTCPGASACGGLPLRSAQRSPSRRRHQRARPCSARVSAGQHAVASRWRPANARTFPAVDLDVGDGLHTSHQPLELRARTPSHHPQSMRRAGVPAQRGRG
eukprot:3830728-Rhodomonas_salina.2